MANEVRLIDANAAMLNTYNDAYWTESEAAAVRSFLVHQPTINPEALRPKGRWEYSHTDTSGGGNLAVVKCSNCEHEAYAIAIYVKEGSYCPICGAKMEG